MKEPFVSPTVDERSHSTDPPSLGDVLLEISTRFVKLSAEQLDDEINNALRILGEYTQTDRVCIDQFSANRSEFRLTHMWQADWLRAEVEPERVVLTERMPWYTARMLNGQPLIFSDLEELPDEAEAEIRNSHERGIQSSAIVPLVVGGDVIGSLGFNMIRQPTIWSEELLDGLNLCSQVIANAIIRQQNEQQLQERLRFEAMIAEISIPFVSATRDEIDAHINHALRQIGEYLDIERVTLVKFNRAGAHVDPTHHWADKEYPLDDFIKSVPVEEHFPVVTRHATECNPLVVHNTENFPDDAVNEREYCRKVGIKSLLMIPLALGNSERMVLAVDAMRAPRHWDVELVERLKVLTEIFANALLRTEKDQKLSVAYAQIEQLSARLRLDNAYLREEIDTKLSHDGIVGKSQQIRRVLTQAEEVAVTESTVLILGETGTGKELLARDIHGMSTRKERPLYVVNCASLSASLIEGELFGREKGAYTGALTKQTGRFEIANGSTIFLDEIGELGLEVQAKLLRVLETGQFERLGSPQTLDTDVRVISATNRDLTQAVRDGTFREDLFYRLNVFPVTMPPLRERREDIPLLVWTFVREFAGVMGKTIDTIPRRTMKALQHFAWPGNIRELRNVIERSVIVSKTNVLQVALPGGDGVKNLKLTLEDVEKQHIFHILEQTGWRIKGTGGAAEILDIHPSTLNSRMQKLGIIRPK